jgi:hypothetical protein
MRISVHSKASRRFRGSLAQLANITSSGALNFRIISQAAVAVTFTIRSRDHQRIESESCWSSVNLHLRWPRSSFAMCSFEFLIPVESVILWRGLSLGGNHIAPGILKDFGPNASSGSGRRGRACLPLSRHSATTVHLHGLGLINALPFDEPNGDKKAGIYYGVCTLGVWRLLSLTLS